jgi:hypothetical protein
MPFTESQRLTDPSGTPNFGQSVALAGDGNTALIAAPGDASVVGSATVFIRSGATWTFQQTLVPSSGGASKELAEGIVGGGPTVALSADGSTALVGNPADNFSVGSATVFIRNGATWTNQHTLLGLTSGSDKEIGAGYFGCGVALSSDGNTALVGAPNDRSGAGSATVFVRNGATWTNQHTLLGLTSGSDKETPAGNFGASVALSSDGNTALVGAPNDRNGAGSATVFIRNGATWTNQHTLFAPTSGPDKEIGLPSFGSYVALSPDGNTALVGGLGDDADPGKDVFAFVGAAWAFTRSGATWTGGQKLTPPSSGADAAINNAEGGGVQFGTSAALSSDGATAVIGGPNDNGGVGAVWAFDFQPKFLDRPAGWFEEQKITAPTTGPDKSNGPSEFGFNVALSPDGSTLLVGGPNYSPDGIANDEVGCVWVFEAVPLPPPR